jgi:hypothetical protein
MRCFSARLISRAEKLLDGKTVRFYGKVFIESLSLRGLSKKLREVKMVHFYNAVFFESLSLREGLSKN